MFHCIVVFLIIGGLCKEGEWLVESFVYVWEVGDNYMYFFGRVGS